LPYIPHTGADVRAMLDRIGVDCIDQLFDEIPPELRVDSLPGVPAPLSEMEVARLAAERAAMDSRCLNFIGAGAYEHHIPAPVWALATRGEIYSAYTPYQAEASQGTLQIMYEYQSMIAGLTGMDVSNASLYDGASALAEACLMAVRAHRRSQSARILMPASVNPVWRKVARAITEGQRLQLEALPVDPARGTIDPKSLERYTGQDVTAIVIQQRGPQRVVRRVELLLNQPLAERAGFWELHAPGVPVSDQGYGLGDRLGGEESAPGQHAGRLFGRALARDTGHRCGQRPDR